MNGEPLPREHGFPARMIIPGLYGFISATKWLTKLTLTTYADQEAYWTERDWATDAPIKISARIDTPKALAEIDRRRDVIGGVAWAQQDGGVAKVQVQVDGGAWQDATLGPDAGNDYWRQWFYKWDAELGPAQHLRARARRRRRHPDRRARQPVPRGCQRHPADHRQRRLTEAICHATPIRPIRLGDSTESLRQTTPTEGSTP